MQSNRSIACGFVKISKDLVAEFWKNLAEELNSAGPPVKNVTEWKKVWSDQKRYIRLKAASNMKNQRGTGGGPNQTMLFSTTEQCIYDLIGMKESVEGLENSLTFGLPACVPHNEKESEPSTYEVIYHSDVDYESPVSSKQLTESAEKIYSCKRKRVDKSDKLNTADLIAREVKTQENLYSKIVEVTDSINSHNKEMQVIMRRVYRSLEKSNEFKAKKLKMLERHHAVCEELRLKEVNDKIEKNRRLLEIEEIKLQVFQKKKERY